MPFLLRLCVTLAFAFITSSILAAIMYSPAQLGLRYIKYYLTASNGKGHGTHSPFVFDFITHVLNDDRNFYAYTSIEQVRARLLGDVREITIEDFGAGSRVKKNSRRSVGEIAGSSLKPKKYSQLLFRIADHYGCSRILELGTSLGITTAYLASAGVGTEVITMEGAPEVAKLAEENFRTLGLRNIELMVGNFDETLPAAIGQVGTVDLAFIDGNHRYAPTIRYFKQLLPAVHDHSMIIFDDIHWSKEMEKAWEEIKADPAVTLSIDLFFIGIILFRKENKARQHFTIRF